MPRDLVITHKTLEYLEGLSEEIISGEINDIMIVYIDQQYIKPLFDAMKKGKINYLSIYYNEIDLNLITDLILNCDYLISLELEIHFYEDDYIIDIFKSLGTKKYLEIFNYSDDKFFGFYSDTCSIYINESIIESKTLHTVNIGIPLDLNIIDKLEINKKYVVLKQFEEEINLFNMYLSKCKIKINYEIREEFILFTEKIEIKKIEL